MKPIRHFVLVASVVVLTACQARYHSVPDFLTRTGFQSPLFCQVIIAGVTKNTNQDDAVLLSTLRQATVVDQAVGPADYTLYFEQGSAFQSEVCAVHVAKSGVGYIEYEGRKVLTFSCPALPDKCQEAFDKSDVVLQDKPQLP